MRGVAILLVVATGSPALAQAPSKPVPIEEKEIVVSGVANGARVVEVDFDKVWKACAECKRALTKLDRLAQTYRDEVATIRNFGSGPGGCANSAPSTLTTFQRSGAEDVAAAGRRGTRDVQGELCTARRESSTQFTQQAMMEHYARPEQAKLLVHMRSFLDQLAPHVARATEEERVLHKASAGLIDGKRTKLSATNVKRIDVTEAVIRRLDATDFTIALPDPPPPGPASGGYVPVRRKTKG